MNKAEKVLLDSLKDKNENAPLENIRNVLGEVSFVPGNPIFKGEISLTITTHFFTLGAEILPAILPPQLQIPIPIYLFGLTDYFGGYQKARTILPMNIWNFLNLGVWIPAVAPVAQVGDVFYQGTATIAGQVYDFLITIHCNNIAYGTFLHGFVSDIIVLNMIRCTVPMVNINQLINHFVFGHQSIFGKLKTDSIDPRTYITSSTFQQQIADIPINLSVDKNLILCYYQEFDCQQLNLILSVSKIQPLQLKLY